MYHLRKSPGTKGGQDDNSEKIGRIGAEEGREGALLSERCGNIALNFGELYYRIQKTALIIQYGYNDGADAEQHDNALDKIIDGSRHIAAQYDIDSGQNSHCDDTDGIRNIERDPEQARQAVVDGGGIGNQEDEGNGGGRNLQRLAEIPLPEVIRHCCCGQVVGHNAGPSAEHDPGKQASEECIAQTDPGRGKTVLPSELSGVTDEYDGGKIGCAVRECGQPRADGTSAQNEIIHVGCMLAGSHSDQNHNSEKQKKHDDFYCHDK